MRCDRRTYRRKPVEIEVEFSTDGGLRRKATVINISPKGLCIISPDKAGRFGDQVVIFAGSALCGRAGVRFQRLEANGNIRLGLKFRPESEAATGIGPDHSWQLRLPGPSNDYAFQFYDRLRRLESYVQRNFDQKISLEEAAGIAALERSYFCRYFHKKVGMSFVQWMQRIRLQNCIEILLESDSSITEACYQSGFGDLRHFERIFRKWTDLSPTDFRNLTVP